MQVAYQTGRYKTQVDNIDNRPYGQYVAVLDSKTRPEHAQLHGLIFWHDAPFWNSFYPPNGWRCRCRVNALSGIKKNISSLMKKHPKVLILKMGRLMGLSCSFAFNGNSVFCFLDFVQSQKHFSLSLLALEPSNGFSSSSAHKKNTLASVSLNGAPDGIRTHAYRNHNPRS